jgi:hypothetical protein
VHHLHAYLTSAYRFQDAFLSVRSELCAIIFGVREMGSDFEVAANAGRKEKDTNYQIHKWYTAFGRRQKDMVARPGRPRKYELLLPARMVNRFPYPCSTHINTFVFRSVHHHSLSSTPSFFSLLSFFWVVASVTHDCLSFYCRASAHTFRQRVLPSAMFKACPGCQGRPHRH